MSQPSSAPTTRSNGFAIASLVFGILGGSILALVFGYVGKSQIDRSEGRQGGRGIAVAGIVLGWIGVVITVAVVVVALVSAHGGDSGSHSTASGDVGSDGFVETPTVVTVAPTATVATTVPPSTATRGPRTYVVTDGVFVRSGPGTTYPPVGSIAVNTNVLFECRTQGEMVSTPGPPTLWWDRTSHDGAVGFVTEQYVGNQADLAAGTLPPTC
ncbi:MAG TPA: DUF4190 domain-containing protein [Acidimicrobiia bacterium]